MKTPKETPKIITGKEAVENAKAAGFTCEYVDGRPQFIIETELERERAHKWARANYGRSYSVCGPHRIKKTPTETQT